ncbi:hypothetical protein [Flavobacterium poyangense]|jgi:hypothetical protein|uniref:hypothetical protein n=1 Tax=Flavobacterium poyangense TaxID=2204302 RepID=UPI001421BD7F|nr:hypothetical protein [Flavobacterium sp. JXAS1]
MESTNEILEVEFIDGEALPVVLKMFDGNTISIGKNVQDFYFKLLELPVSYRCQLLNLDINELQKFIKEHNKYYNQKLINEFNKTWLWCIDSEIYDFHDKEVNNDFFGVLLDKKQIIGKLKRNTFDALAVFRMLDFFENNDDIKEDFIE